MMTPSAHETDPQQRLHDLEIAVAHLLGEVEALRRRLAETPQILDARMFRLVDDDGRTRATMVAKAGGPVGLSLFDVEGHRVVTITGDRDVASFSLATERQERAYIAARGDATLLRLGDAEGTSGQQVELHATRGEAALQLAGGGRKLATLAGSDDAGYLVMASPGGGERTLQPLPPDDADPS